MKRKHSNVLRHLLLLKSGLLVAMGLLLGVSGASAALPLLPGQAVTTRFSGSDNNVNLPLLSGTVLNVIDIRDPVGTGANFGGTSTNWNAPKYQHPSWNAQTMGEVFGVAVDQGAASPDIYVTSSSSDYFGNPAFNMVPSSMVTGYGGVFKINGATGVVSLLAELPSAAFSKDGFTRYAGLAQIAINPTTHTLYVSNLENGLIYVLDTATGAIKQAFDHGTQLASPTIADDATAGFTALGRRVTAVQYNAVENRLYYIVVSSTDHELWSAPLTSAGTVDTAGALKELTRSRKDWAWENEILLWTDIAFDHTGKRMLAGFMTIIDGQRRAHYSGAREWVGSSGNWTRNTDLEGGNGHISVGNLSGKTNSAGAVAYGYNNYGTYNAATEPCNDALVMMGDGLVFNSDNNVFSYGLQISPLTGVTSATMGQDDYFVDLEGATGSDNEGNDKSGLGDVEILSGCTPPPVITFTPPPGPSAMSCPSDVRLATSVHVNGDSQAAGSTGAAVNGLITFDYAATGELAAPFSKATAGQVGAVWGLAYDTPRKKLYAAAFLKRHASFGPNGIGAIYQMDGTSATPTPSLLIDLAAQGVDVGSSPRVPASGAVDDPNELPADASQPSWDRDAFAQVGKISIGDIDISADGNTLWAINLKQRELVEIDLATTTVKAKHAITDPGCSNGEFRPWAVKVHDGKVWVGSVCSAETSQQASDLKAYVQAFDGTAFTTATSFALNYPKGSIGNGPGDEKWQPWKDTFTTLASGDFAIYPQPILSDIEFDMDGSLILGFMDRMGHQVGGVNYTPNYPDDDTMIQGQTGGDIIRVCNNGGKYELENNATCTSGSTAGKDKGQGPGNGEYYWGDMWDFNPWNADGGFHQETSFGGLAFKAGSGEIALSAMNPLKPNANAGGVIWLDNATGGRSPNEGVQIYQGNAHYFGKASGMGDVELFCAEAALQPDLSLTKVADKTTVKRGDTVVYTLTLTNESDVAATGIKVTDQLPSGVTLSTTTAPVASVGTFSASVWDVGTLAGKASATLTLTVTVD